MLATKKNMFSIENTTLQTIKESLNKLRFFTVRIWTEVKS